MFAVLNTGGKQYKMEADDSDVPQKKNSIVVAERVHN